MPTYYPADGITSAMENRATGVLALDIADTIGCTVALFIAAV